jgi:chitin synthase
MAYMLADWDGHPGSNGSLNVLYPPYDGAGMDASLLFPTYAPECDNVFIPLQGQQPNYFPCQLFNPNNTVPPDASLYSNRTLCHTSKAALDMFNSFNTDGVPKKDGGFNAASKIYYNYDDVNSTSHLMLYNG